MQRNSTVESRQHRRCVLGIREGKGREDRSEWGQREGEEGKKGEGRPGSGWEGGGTYRRRRKGINLPHGRLKTLAALVTV